MAFHAPSHPYQGRVLLCWHVMENFFKGSCFSISQVVSREIRRVLHERAAQFSIALDDVSITNLTFGHEFTAAIEAKQVAAQDAERAKFVVEKAEQDKRSAIIRAQVLHFFPPDWCLLNLVWLMAILPLLSN